MSEFQFYVRSEVRFSNVWQFNCSWNSQQLTTIRLFDFMKNHNFLNFPIFTLTFNISYKLWRKMWFNFPWKFLPERLRCFTELNQNKRNFIFHSKLAQQAYIPYDCNWMIQRIFTFHSLDSAHWIIKSDKISNIFKNFSPTNCTA